MKNSDIKLMSKELAEKINNYFVYDGNPCIIDNIELFYDLSRLINKTYGRPMDDDYSFYTKATLSQNKKLIEDFYEKYNIDINLDKLITDGSIDLVFNEDKLRFYGQQKGERREVVVASNGLIADSAIMVHELSHLYDLPDSLLRTNTNDLLTEALAYTYEHIFLDYLYDLGYKEDAVSLKRYISNNLIYLSRIMESTYRLMIIYKNFSDINKDSYNMFFNSTYNYNKDIKTLNKNIESLSNQSAWYILALPLYKYMYYRYRENNDFLNNIKRLQNSINGKDMLKCLEIIELSDLGNNDKKILKKYMNKDKNIMRHTM